MSCRRCDHLSALPALDICYLWVPEGHVQAKIVRALADTDTDLSCLDDGRVIRLSIGNVEAFSSALISELTHQQLCDTKALPVSQEPPSLADFAKIVTLEVLTGHTEAQWLTNLMLADRLVCHCQPIVRAAGDNLRLEGYEFLLRGIEPTGNVVGPDRLFGAARNPSLLFQLDRHARLKAVESAVSFNLDCCLFINFVPSAIYDPSACLQTTVRAIELHGIRHEQVVFEVVESEAYEDFRHLKSIVDFYRQHGFRIALDDFGSGFNNLTTLLSLRPDFIKLDKSLTSGVLHDHLHQDIVGRMIELAHAAGIEIVAEGVETIDSLNLLRELGSDLFQGYLFGKPAATPEATWPKDIADPAQRSHAS